MTGKIIQIAVAVFAIAVAFFASTWVNSMSRLSKGRAAQLAEAQPKRGKLLVHIAENPPRFLSSVLLIMLVARVTAVVLATSLIMNSGTSFPEVVAIVCMSFVLFEVAEIAPRTWVLERLDRVLLASARPTYFIGKVLRPFSGLLVAAGRLFLLILPGHGLPKGPLTSEEEIKSMLEMAEIEEVIEADERDMIHSIFEFTDTVVREVMVPRPDMICIDGQASLEQVLELTLKKGYSRIPVINETIDQVMGIVYQKDVIRKLHNGRPARNRKAADVAREATFVPESKKVADLLKEMKTAKAHMVIVVDEYGGTAGLATLEDLLEEIVGEISDEYDKEEPNVEMLDDNALRVTARFGIEQLNELLGAELPHADWDTVGGLIGGLLGRVPSEGDTVIHDGIEFEVEKMKGRRIAKILVTKPNGEPAQAETG
ncbi:MAG: hemolysin family protein [Actinomycetota bacterium]